MYQFLATHRRQSFHNEQWQIKCNKLNLQNIVCKLFSTFMIQ